MDLMSMDFMVHHGSSNCNEKFIISPSSMKMLTVGTTWRVIMSSPQNPVAVAEDMGNKAAELKEVVANVLDSAGYDYSIEPVRTMLELIANEARNGGLAHLFLCARAMMRAGSPASLSAPWRPADMNHTQSADKAHKFVSADRPAELDLAVRRQICNANP